MSQDPTDSTTARPFGLRRRAARTTTPSSDAGPPPPARGRWLRVGVGLLVVLALLAGIGLLVARYEFRKAMLANLPRIDGNTILYGLHAPVTVERDSHGVPHITAGSMDDLLMAQGYVTAQDRLWQMDLLRRHAAGDL